MIQLKDLEVGYRFPLFTIQSMELSKGNVYVLVGKNGAGKSTLFKTITREIPPLNGSVFFNGEPLNVLSKKTVARTVSFVPSRFPLLDFVSVEEYLGLGRAPHTSWTGRLSSIDKASVDSVIRRLGVEHLRGKLTSDLSDGERQLIAIGRSLIQETPIILLDEPTAFLDYSNKRKIIQLLKEIAVEEEKVVLLSSHDIELCVDSFNMFFCINKEEKSAQLLFTQKLDEIIDFSFS